MSTNYMNIIIATPSYRPLSEHYRMLSRHDDVSEDMASLVAMKRVYKEVEFYVFSVSLDEEDYGKVMSYVPT